MGGGGRVRQSPPGPPLAYEYKCPNVHNKMSTLFILPPKIINLQANNFEQNWINEAFPETIMS